MDAAAEWEQARQRVVGLVADLGEDEAEAAVPACPDWSIRQLVAHMVGLDADVLAGDEPDDHNAAWTQRQVDDRDASDLAAIVAEWEQLAPRMRAYLADSPRPLGDVIIHEQDLRGAVGIHGGRDTDGLAAIRDSMLGRFDDAVGGSGLAPVRLVGDDGWEHATGDGAPGLVLEAPTFDLARAVMSRRSADQLGRWVASGDLGPYREHFEVLGPLPDVDLTD